MNTSMRLRFELTDLSFDTGSTGQPLAVYSGWVASSYSKRSFQMKLSRLSNGEWRLESLEWKRPPSAAFRTREVHQALVNLGAKILYPIHMWPGEQSESGTNIVLNQKIPPTDVADAVYMAWRPDALKIPAPAWSSLWPRIESRLAGDPCFRVQGYSAEDTARAISEIKKIFPAEWVAARFRAEAEGEAMTSRYPREAANWFPAYHLARSACGVLCVEPAWTYLVEIGLARASLSETPGVSALERQLTRSSGTRHHLCYAADFHRRGLLRQLEPDEGSGHNDLGLSGPNGIVEVEVKEFTSDQPGERLSRELAKKAERMPREPVNPVVVHAVLAEPGYFLQDRESHFVRAAKELADKLPTRISALVIGRCYLDASGGPVKRDVISVLPNASAVRPLAIEDLHKLFPPQTSTPLYPLVGFGSYIELG